MPPESHEIRLAVTGALDRVDIEALRLDVRDVARRYGLTVKDFRVEDVPADSPD